MKRQKTTRICPITGDITPNNQYVSTNAIQQLETQARKIPNLNTTIQQIIQGAGKTQPPTTHHTPGPTTPINLNTHDKATQHLNTINQWANWLLATYAHSHATGDPVDNANTLIIYTQHAATNPQAPNLIRETLHAIQQLETLADKPAPIIGTCTNTINYTNTTQQCGAPIRAWEDTNTTLPCPQCGTTHNATEIGLQQLAQYANDPTATLTATQAQLWAHKHRQHLPANTIRKWAQRGQITPNNTYQGQPTYLWKDIWKTWQKHTPKTT